MPFMNRLSAAWKALLGQVEKISVSSDEERLNLLREIASLKLELQEARDLLAQERSRITVLEKAQEGNIQANVESQLEEIFTHLAAPMSQLLMQSSLLDTGTTVGATDVMALARNLIDGIEQAGLERIGTAGEMMPFDPETAQPLSSDTGIQKGEQVVVKFPGYRYSKRVIRKAFVEKKG